ncbi:hypothetical protein [Lujinxingia litoralis]|uniref:hypothetical protein n=1 Tax=Lujinxingia litoralis TaxID=2211119 RepID=UPI0011B93BF1|nr:hypothetical protein [Lujinxingia litoralis]
MSEMDARQRRMIFRVLEIGAVLVSFGVLYVGLTVARGLESVAVEWGAKVLAVVVLAALFTVLRRARSGVREEEAKARAEREASGPEQSL